MHEKIIHNIQLLLIAGFEYLLVTLAITDEVNIIARVVVTIIAVVVGWYTVRYLKTRNAMYEARKTEAEIRSRLAEAELEDYMKRKYKDKISDHGTDTTATQVKK